MKNQHVDNDAMLALPPMLDYCPQYWKNFVKHATHNFSPDSSTVADVLLKKHNAEMYQVFDEYIVQFKNSQDLVWFILKWS